MKNKIEDLRNHLFATLEALQDKDNPMELERAMTIAEVGKVVIESAKVEVAYVRAIGATSGTGFMSEVEKTRLAGPENPALPGASAQPKLVKS